MIAMRRLVLFGGQHPGDGDLEGQPRAVQPHGPLGDPRNLDILLHTHRNRHGGQLGIQGLTHERRHILK